MTAYMMFCIYIIWLVYENTRARAYSPILNIYDTKYICTYVYMWYMYICVCVRVYVDISVLGRARMHGMLYA